LYAFSKLLKIKPGQTPITLHPSKHRKRKMNWIFVLTGTAGVILVLIGFNGLLNEKRGNEKKRDSAQHDVYNPKEFRKPRIR
jgi:hypothetical protein